jgi:hypothetical protein
LVSRRCPAARRRRSPPEKESPPKKGKKGTPNRPGPKSSNTERAVVLSYVKRLKGDFKTGKDAAESLQSPITTQGWGKVYRKRLDGPERKFFLRCLRSESGSKNTQKPKDPARCPAYSSHLNSTCVFFISPQ